MSKPKQFTIFDFLKSIIDTKQNWDSFTPEQQKLFNGFLINKFLSMNPKYIELVNYVQSLNFQNNKKIYEVYCWMIPQSKNTYSPYIKSNVKKSIPEESIKCTAEYFECSLNEAEDYINLMDNKWLEIILTAKGVDDKQIKKLVK
jgi:hypothetical protein